MSRWSIPIVGLGLALSLSGCVSSGNPTDLIPIGLRTTFGAEDRNANPNKPMTGEQLLAKLRGEPIPAAPEPVAKPPAMPSIPSSWTSSQAGPQGGPQIGPQGGPAGMPMPMPMPMPTPQPSSPQKSEDAKPALSEMVLRFEGVSPDPRAEDGLRVQLASTRAAKLGGISATIRVGPAGLDKIASLSLAMRRGEAVRALLPEAMAKTADVSYSPSVEPGSARFDLR